LLAKHIQHLLSRFGIFATIKNKLDKYRSSFIITIDKNVHVKTFIQEIGLLNYSYESELVQQNVKGEHDLDSSNFCDSKNNQKNRYKKNF
jgi:hypothetical protein